MKGDITFFVDEAPSAIETAEGVFLVLGDGTVIDRLTVSCTMCGRPVTGFFDHVAIDCEQMEDAEVDAAMADQVSDGWVPFVDVGTAASDG
jgi:hypothetical protein